MNKFEYTLNEIKNEYEEAVRLKENKNGSVSVYIHRKLNKKLIVRIQKGNYSAFEALKGIANKNIVRVYDVIKDEDEPNFLVLEEYIEGETLSGILKRRLFGERETTRIISQLCDALYAINSVNIVHRDIKPENIMTDKNGVLKLIDFSAARLYLPGGRSDTEVIGTVGFAAPEQFGLAQSDKQVDIYAAGVLMNVLLTGEHPAVKLYPGRLRRVIEKCVRTIPGKRFKDATELKRSL